MLREQHGIVGARRVAKGEGVEEGGDPPLIERHAGKKKQWAFNGTAISYY